MGELLNTDNVCWQEDLLPQYHRMFEMIARSAGNISSMNLVTKRCVERYSSAKSRKSQGTHACLYIAHVTSHSHHVITMFLPQGVTLSKLWGEVTDIVPMEMTEEVAHNLVAARLRQEIPLNNVLQVLDECGAGQKGLRKVMGHLTRDPIDAMPPHAMNTPPLT